MLLNKQQLALSLCTLVQHDYELINDIILEYVEMIDDTKAKITYEETFGPVAPIYKFSSDEEVINLANDTPFGLASYFFARDIGRIWKVAEALEYGIVSVNTGLPTKAEIPFGGVKESGMGREGSRYGLDDYLIIKYISMGGI